MWPRFTPAKRDAQNDGGIVGVKHLRLRVQIRDSFANTAGAGGKSSGGLGARTCRSRRCWIVKEHYLASRAGKSSATWMEVAKKKQRERGENGTDAVIELAQNGNAACLC